MGGQDDRPAADGSVGCWEGQGRGRVGKVGRLTSALVAGNGLHYRALYNPDPPHTKFVADLEHDTTLPILRDYFQLDQPLVPLYDEWARADAHFAKKLASRGEELEGIRILNQPPWETLIR